MIKFATDEWIKALMEVINKSEAYAQAARSWEGDFYFIVDAGDGIEEPVYLYMDLWHGKCREAFATTDPSVKAPVFRMSGPLSKWRKVIEKKLDPIQGLLTRQFKLKGDMVMIMKNVKAAQELVNCTTLVPTQFPE
ncbi:MAG: SCP2 sterol-binding domain-containing protein [Anaerolineae bacterium]